MQVVFSMPWGSDSGLSQPQSSAAHTIIHGISTEREAGSKVYSSAEFASY